MKAQETIGPHCIAYISIITGHCNAVNIHEAYRIKKERTEKISESKWNYRWGLWPHHITFIAVITGHWKTGYSIQKEIAERISWSKWMHRRVGVNECTEGFGTRSHHLTLLQIMVTAEMTSTWNSHTKKELQKAHLWEWRYTMWKVQWKECCFSWIRFTVECLKTKPLESIFHWRRCFFRPDVVLYQTVVVSAQNSSLVLKIKYTGDATAHNNVWIHKVCIFIFHTIRNSSRLFPLQI